MLEAARSNLHQKSNADSPQKGNLTQITPFRHLRQTQVHANPGESRRISPTRYQLPAATALKTGHSPAIAKSDAVVRQAQP